MIVRSQEVTTRELVVTLSLDEVRVILVALESAQSEEEESVFEFAQRLDAFVRSS